MKELRCYTWTLFQLSPIQHGIQAGHAAVELVRSHDQNGYVQEWADEWKTLICLNGGNLAELRDLMGLLSVRDNPYPWAVFYESEDALGGIPTSVAIILPERIFEGANGIRKGSILPYMHIMGMDPQFNDWEWQIMLRIAASGLAR